MRAIKKCWGKDGVTLIEVIVTFAVAAIFLTAAVALISPFSKMYMRIMNANRVHNDARILTEKFKEEMTFAEGYQMSTIYVSDNTIWYSNKGGNPAEIFTNENGMVIRYEAVKNETGGTLYEDTDWYYGKNFYKNNKVEMRFSKVGDKAVIKAEIKVYNDIYQYSQDIYVSCVNLSSGSSIIEGEPPKTNTE